MGKKKIVSTYDERKILVVICVHNENYESRFYCHFMCAKDSCETLLHWIRGKRESEKGKMCMLYVNTKYSRQKLTFHSKAAKSRLSPSTEHRLSLNTIFIFHLLLSLNISFHSMQNIDLSISPSLHVDEIKFTKYHSLLVYVQPKQNCGVACRSRLFGTKNELCERDEPK